MKLRDLVTEPVNGRAGTLNFILILQLQKDRAISTRVQLTPYIAMAPLGYFQDGTILWEFNMYVSFLMFNLYCK